VTGHAFRRQDDDAPHTDPVPSEEELRVIASVRTGDSAAFERLFTTHYEALCGFVHGYLRSREATEDLVQDLFASIWENRERWRPGGTIRQYLFTAARNRALSHLRHAVVVRRFEDRAKRDPVPSACSGRAAHADGAVYVGELTAAFEEAVRALPEGRRRVLLLRWEGELSHAEIAQVLGISVKGVETQIGRAMRSIRERLAHFRPSG
jgi:RNA polymerase sigma-70 factor (ECF subfamily)